MDRDRSDPIRAALQEAVDGRYDIVELHGRGGMGMVYCAHDRELGRLVAIKVLTPEHALTPQARERFRREARLSASLSHPSIVTVFGFGETRDFAYIVMEFIRGEPLGRRLRHEGRVSPNLTRQILVDLAGALDHAHGKDIIHRDLKPENVLIAADSGRALLTDFGIAKALTDDSNLTPSRSAIGTPEYMSPEQAAGERSIDGRSDLYSLGALGYTMLAGRPPHQGESVAGLMARIVTEEPVPLRTLAPDAPQDLVSAIMRCLEKSPERRWPDAHLLHRALAREADEDDPGGAELRGMTGFGAFVLLVIVTALSFAASSLRSGDLSGAWVALGAGLIVSAGFVISARGVATSGGYSRGDVLRVSMWPPKWWGLWWPRRLRRPGDVWDVLPTSARLTRVLLSIMFALTLVWFVVGRKPSWMMPIVRGLWGAVLLVVAIALARWRHRRFSAHHASHLLFGPTIAATFWSLPHVRAVLVARSGTGVSRTTPVPATVRDMFHAIEEAAGTLTGKARQQGSAAADAARLLVNEIERLDTEIQDLERDANPEYLAELERRLELHKTQSVAREALEVYIRSMEKEAELLEVKRLHHQDAYGSLRELWTLIDQLRVQSTHGTADAELVDRLHALVSAIRRQFGAGS